jgi:hypothetical protein
LALTTSEVESLRFHLGYGNAGVGAYPYTPDGFQAIFEQVVAPNLTGSTETTATTAISAGSTTTVTPVSMTGIVVHAALVIDVGPAAEMVQVRSVTATTFTATFSLEHPASGYPVALMGGHARLRWLLSKADAAWVALQDATIGDTAGLKQVDKGDIEWFPGFEVLDNRKQHYAAIVEQISSLVRVEPVRRGRTGLMEAY